MLNKLLKILQIIYIIGGQILIDGLISFLKIPTIIHLILQVINVTLCMLIILRIYFIEWVKK